MSAFALSRRAALLSGFALSLGACDEEPAQRKAFISFLQTRILDRPGVHLPRPSAEETKSWGDYAKHYAVIVDFNDALSERVSKPMQDVVQRGTPRSLQEVVDRRGDLQQIQRGIAALQAELQRQLEAADAAHAALKQPDDLKRVYDAAYERDVTGPARAFREVMPVVSESLAAALALADFLAQNRAKIRFNGPMVEVSDPALQREVQARLTAMNGKAQAMQAAQQRLRSVVSGS